MFIARWIVEIRFGQKDNFMRVLRTFKTELGADFGQDMSKVRWLNASIGGPESRYEQEFEVGSLQELEDFWGRVGKSQVYAGVSKELAELIIPGSNRWEVFRVVDF